MTIRREIASPQQAFGSAIFALSYAQLRHYPYFMPDHREDLATSIHRTRDKDGTEAAFALMQNLSGNLRTYLCRPAIDFMKRIVMEPHFAKKLDDSFPTDVAARFDGSHPGTFHDLRLYQSPVFQENFLAYFPRPIIDPCYPQEIAWKLYAIALCERAVHYAHNPKSDRAELFFAACEDLFISQDSQICARLWELGECLARNAQRLSHCFQSTYVHELLPQLSLMIEKRCIDREDLPAIHFRLPPCFKMEQYHNTQSVVAQMRSANVLCYSRRR